MARNEIRIAARRSIWRDPAAVQELRKALIAAKHELSFAARATVSVRSRMGAFTCAQFSREEFERTIAPVVDRTMGPVKIGARRCALKPADMDEVVLVGGSTRVPLVRRMVEAVFRPRPHD